MGWPALVPLFAGPLWPPETVGAFWGRSAGRVCSAFTQLDGLSFWVQNADHSETRNRWDGRLQEAFGSNMWSWRTKSLA